MLHDEQNDPNTSTKTDAPSVTSVLVPVGDGHEEWDVIYRYTRANMLEDGTLVDVSPTATHAGIRYPVAVSRAVWKDCVELSDAAKRAGNDEEGRLWDVMWMLRRGMLQNPAESEFRFQIYVVTTSVQPSRLTLKAVWGPGDDGEPVITVLLPDED